MDENEQKDNLKEKAKKSAFWFFAIAVLSIVNTYLLSTGVYFHLGLAVSQMLDAYFMGATGSINLLYSFIAPFVFCLLGWLAFRLHRWAFIFGSVIYLIDGIMYAFLNEWFSVLFHAFILYQLYLGIRSLHNYRKENS
jgi:hypothetical protein